MLSFCVTDCRVLDQPSHRLIAGEEKKKKNKTKLESVVQDCHRAIAVVVVWRKISYVADFWTKLDSGSSQNKKKKT